MEEIILNNDVKIYKTKFVSPYSVTDTLEKVDINIFLNKRTTDDRVHENVGPGIQSPIILKCPELETIVNHAVNVCEGLYGKKNYGHLVHSWIAISKSDRTKYLWHKHVHFPPPHHFIDTDYTFTYYLQMPDNLTNEDGMLLFRTNDGVVHKFLPEENDMFIFPPDLDHVVEWNKNSTKDRVVIASNIKFADSLKKLKECTQKIL